jgi:DNA-binding MarR family transcriptional regulator
VTEQRFGFELPLLLAGSFRLLIDALHAELAEQGHPNARPSTGFALQALGPEGATISELGRRMGVSKQAAAKAATGLERLGYVEREPDVRDARSVRLRRSARGEALLAASARIFERLREEWVRELGADRVSALEDDLSTMIAGAGGVRLGDLPGWLR